jgi:hypothetical protein
MAILLRHRWPGNVREIEDEPRKLPQPAGARARELHESAADQAAVEPGTGDRGPGTGDRGPGTVRSICEGRESFPPLDSGHSLLGYAVGIR